MSEKEGIGYIYLGWDGRPGYIERGRKVAGGGGKKR